MKPRFLPKSLYLLQNPVHFKPAQKYGAGAPFSGPVQARAPVECRESSFRVPARSAKSPARKIHVANTRGLQIALPNTRGLQNRILTLAACKIALPNTRGLQNRPS
jgi:hypothetical protein